MDRINKFLASREKKGVKTLRVLDKRYKICKNDIKLVREYMKCKNLSGFKLQDCKVDAGKMDAILSKKKSYNKEMHDRRWLEKNKNKFEKNEEKIFEEKLYDIYEGESLSDYKQEWVYDITSPYEGKIEDLYTNDLKDMEQFAKKFRTPVEKSISIEEIVKFKKQCLEMSYLGHHEASVENIANVDAEDLCYGEGVFSLHFGAYANEENLFLFKNGELSKNGVFFSKNVLSFAVKNESVYVLTNKECKVFDYEGNVIKFYKFKGENVNKICVDNSGNIFAGGSCGVKKIKNAESVESYGFVNYAIDFAVKEDAKAVVKNINKIYFIRGGQKYQITKGEI